MFDDTNFTNEMLANPPLLVSAVIDAMEASDTSSNPISINDPNNGFVIMMALNAKIFSAFSEKIDYATAYYYPQRATSSAQLFPHLSKYDYKAITAAPAAVPFRFAMSAQWIIDNAVYYNASYNKLVIPSTSYFTMAGVTYSMYYPIEILVNRVTNAISAFYDTSVKNSLFSLSSNLLLQTPITYVKNGITWYAIDFDMYQFQCTTTPYTVSSQQGFSQSIAYTDQFYAIQLFTNATDGTLVELNYSLDELFYDYSVPTALINIQPDINTVTITIPQIYFDNGQIGQDITVKFYTTQGAVNYSVSATDAGNLKANFDTGSSSFAAPFTQMASYAIGPKVDVVSGGSNSSTYAQIRDIVVNNRASEAVAINQAQLQQAAIKAGFTGLTKVVDDLTERIYYATSTLLDSTSSIIPCFPGNILLTGNNLSGNPSTILDFTNNYLTILPTTTFVIPSSGTTCVPMTNAAVSAMAAMSTSELVTELNKGTYVRQPFHITLKTTQKSPAVNMYNLMSPAMTSLVFNAENANSAPQMSVTSLTVIHQNSGTGGFLMNFSVARSSNLVGVAASNLQVIISCYDKLGDLVFLPLTYVSSSAGNDIWQCTLNTNYLITNDDYISVTMYSSSGVSSTVDIPIAQTFTVLTSFTSSYDTAVTIDASLNGLLPAVMGNNYTVMTQQTMVVTLGTNLSQTIYCAPTITWGSDVYETAPSTIYYTTNVPIFQTDETGLMVTRLHGSQIQSVTLFNAGSTPPATGNISVTTAAAVPVPTSGTTTTIPLKSTTGLLVGMDYMGANIPGNSKITAVTSTTVTISSLITAALVNGTTHTAVNPKTLVRTSVAQGAIGHVLDVGSTAGILPGETAFGFGLPNGGSLITEVTDTTITLASTTTEAVANNTLLTIVNLTAPGVVKTLAGEVITDANGVALVATSAQNQFAIPAILFDGRIFASTNASDVALVSTIYSDIAAMAANTSSIDSGLSESSEVYYKPLRTMGDTTFNIGNSATASLPLAMSFTLNVYVDSATLADVDLQTTMRNAINTTINTQIQTSPYSSRKIADAISATLGSNITGVEMAGLNNNPELLFISLTGTDVTPSVENILYIGTDGSIGRKPNITVNFVLSPNDTASTSTTSSSLTAN